MKHRLLSILLCLALMLGALPMALAADLTFTDVEPGSYYADAVDWAVAENVTAGTSPTTFSPQNPCTRAQIVTFLWRAAGSPEPLSEENPFADVAEQDYFYSAVLWAVERGITNGTSAAAFSPDLPCTRGQAVTFLYRYSASPLTGETDSPFSDVADGMYYMDAVDWAVGQGITNGTSATTFSPDQTCTRAQIVTFLYRTAQNPQAVVYVPVRRVETEMDPWNDNTYETTWEYDRRGNNILAYSAVTSRLNSSSYNQSMTASYNDLGDLEVRNIYYSSYDGYSFISRKYVYGDGMRVETMTETREPGGSIDQYTYTYYDSGAVKTETLRTLSAGEATKACRVLSYDESGNLLREEQFDEDGQSLYYTAYTYDGYGNMAQARSVYDGAQHIYDYAYDYDSHGIPTRVTVSVDGAVRSTENYVNYYSTYRGREYLSYREMTVSYRGGSTFFWYDQFGNLLKERHVESADGNYINHITSWHYQAIPVSSLPEHWQGYQDIIWGRG